MTFRPVPLLWSSHKMQQKLIAHQYLYCFFPPPTFQCLSAHTNCTTCSGTAEPHNVWEVFIRISDMQLQTVDTYWFIKSSGAAHKRLFKESLQYSFGRNRMSCSWLSHFEPKIMLPLQSVNHHHHYKGQDKGKTWFASLASIEFNEAELMATMSDKLVRHLV